MMDLGQMRDRWLEPPDEPIHHQVCASMVNATMPCDCPELGSLAAYEREGA